MIKKIYSVKGMSCASCAQTVEKALAKVAGVHTASVNFAANQATTEYDESTTAFSDLASAVQGTGYELIDQSFKDGEFKVIGMGSDHCAGVVEKALGRFAGVTNIKTSFANGSAVFSYDPTQVKISELKKAVDEAGQGGIVI